MSTITQKAKTLLLGSGDGGPRPESPRAPFAIIEEASDQSPDYAFRKLSGGQAAGVNDLPDGFVELAIRWSNRLYDSHGLAEFIVETVQTLIMGGGLQYSLKFEKGFPPEYEKAIRDRVKDWWYHEDIQFEDRCYVFLQELLLNGEHGWRFEVNPVNGFVRIGDIARDEVTQIETDKLDKLRLRRITVREENGDERPVTLIAKNPNTKLLEGEGAYHRFKARATKRRGKPVLQNVIDELRSEKQFRLLGTDRSVTRLSIFMDTKITGSDAEVESFAKKSGTTLPTNGRRLFHNESVENSLLSGNIEAADLVDMMQYLVSVVMMSVGFPPSWAGIGEGANRSIAETQQDPAIRNRKRERDQIVRFFERTVDFVIDRAIAAYIGTDLPGDKRISVTDESGKTVERPMRECVTVTISPVPIENTNRDAPPLEATAAALALLDSADEFEGRHGVKIYSQADRIAILNWAHKRDGVDIEVSGEFKTEDPAYQFEDPDVRPPSKNAAPGTPQNGAGRAGVPVAGQTAVPATPNTPGG